MFHKTRQLHPLSLNMILYNLMMKTFFSFRWCSNILKKTVEDSIKCSSHIFSGLLRLMADTVVLESMVLSIFFSFFLSFFLSFYVPFLLLFIFIVIFVVTVMVLNTETKCLLLRMVWALIRQLLMGAD